MWSRDKNGALIIAAMMGLAGGFGMGREITGREPGQQPENRGRRAEKSAQRLAKAEEKRKRRAAKRLAHNVQGKGRAACGASQRPKGAP